MKNTRVNRLLFARGISVADMAARVGRRTRRRCCDAQVSMVANGHRFTPWIQKAIARELVCDGPKLFGEWWYANRGK